MRKVVVIGAGAAGMMAAISAAKHGAHTVVLEHKDRVGEEDPFHRERKMQFYKSCTNASVLSQ